MPIPDETIRLRLTRRGDDWELASAQRNSALKPLELDEDLVAATIVALGPDATSPGEVLEAAGRVLDRRESERITARVVERDEARDLAGDVARVVERLEADDRPALPRSLAIELELDDGRVMQALRHAEADGVARVLHSNADPMLSLWGLAEEVRQTIDDRTPLQRLADEQRAAAQDDPRGEADR